MRIGVKIMPRKEVLDSQGRAVEKTLQAHGQPVSSCIVGKFIELDVEAENISDAKSKAKVIAEMVLYNPLIENCELVELADD